MTIYQENKAEVILRAEGISKYYDNKPFIKNISFSLHKGELLALLGPSGVGKTTLFNVIAGLLPLEEGRIYIHGRDVTLETGHVAYMLQKDLLLPYLTILDNVCLPLFIQKEKKEAAYERALPYFKIFGLTGYEHKYPAALSGGMRQRAAFLRTLLFGQDVFLLDEPFSALDALTRADLHKWFLDLRAELGLSTILITHDVDEALHLADTILLLNGRPGTIVEEIHLDKVEQDVANYLLSEDYFEQKKYILTQFY